MFTLIEAAGWPIYLLLIASLVAVTLITERALFLRRKKIVPPTLIDEVVQELKQRGVSQQMLAKLSEGSPLGKVFAAGLKNIKSAPEVMKESIEEAGRGAAHDLERFLTTLGTIASISPLLGLFGTVIGMIEIFGSQNAGGAAPDRTGARHFGRPVQHRIRSDRRRAQHDRLPPFPLAGRFADHRNGATGNQTG